MICVHFICMRVMISSLKNYILIGGGKGRKKENGALASRKEHVPMAEDWCDPVVVILRERVWWNKEKEGIRKKAHLINLTRDSNVALLETRVYFNQRHKPKYNTWKPIPVPSVYSILARLSIFRIYSLEDLTQLQRRFRRKFYFFPLSTCKLAYVLCSSHQSHLLTKWTNYPLWYVTQIEHRGSPTAKSQYYLAKSNWKCI